MQFTIRYANSHVEVFDPSGHFLFSADTESEARSEMEEMEAA